MPKPASTRSAYKMLTCIYLCRTLLFFAPYADFLNKNRGVSRIKSLLGTYSLCGRIAYSENDVINICNSAIDWDKVNSIIITERNKGINQLKSIIE